jgi:hypothetical protein
MPAKIQPAQTAPKGTPEDALALLAKSVRKAIGRLTRVTMERRVQGHPPRPLTVEVDVSRGADESDDALVDEVTREVFEAIERDADGGPWHGRVFLHDDNATKKSDALIETLDSFRVDDANAPPNREYEVTAMLATMGKFVEGVTKQVVCILAATAGERAAVADLVGRVAKHDGEMSKAYAKYKYKAERHEQETEQMRVREIGKTKRSEKRWENMTDIADRYHDVADKWSDLLIEHVKSSKTAKPPTQAQVDMVFAGEEYDKLRALASEMLHEPARAARMQLGAEFKRVCEALPQDQQNILKLRAVQAFGSPQAAKDAFAWLVKPREPASA